MKKEKWNKRKYRKRKHVNVQRMGAVEVIKLSISGCLS